VVESPQTAEPQTPAALGSDETSRGQVAPTRPCMPSLSSGALQRHYLKQEPYAEEPHVRVRAGGRRATGVPTATLFPLDEGAWNIPAEKMKMKQPHIVPLCVQAVTILTELKQLTGASKYVFPSGRSFARPMSNNTVNAALRRMGYDKETMTGHGFRTMARTILDEVLQVRPDYIEHQLAHAVRDPNGRAYNRTAHLEGRREMMQTWVDYLDGLKQGAQVLPMKRKG
jgi:hypothetical protein